MRRPALSPIELSWADAAFGAFFPDPPHSALPAGARTLAMAESFAAMLTRIPLRQALGLRLAVWLVALSPMLLRRGFATLSGLDPTAREAAVAALLRSRVYAWRQLAMALKAMGALILGRSEAVRRAATGGDASAIEAGDG